MSILTIPFGHDNDSLMNFSQTKNTYFLHSNVAFSALLYCKFDSDEHSYCDNRLTEADWILTASWSEEVPLPVPPFHPSMLRVTQHFLLLVMNVISWTNWGNSLRRVSRSGMEWKSWPNYRNHHTKSPLRLWMDPGPPEERIGIWIILYANRHKKNKGHLWKIVSPSTNSFLHVRHELAHKHFYDGNKKQMVFHATRK